MALWCRFSPTGEYYDRVLSLRGGFSPREQMSRRADGQDMRKDGGRVLVSGASGLIGSAVMSQAQAAGYDAVRLVRRRQAASRSSIYWNPGNPLDSVHPVDLEGLDAVIHLSGATVAHRWTEAWKKEIVVSRVATTERLSRMLAMLRSKPRVLLCASAVGIYGNRGDELLTEESAPGSDFLAETCLQWEAAAQAARDAGIRVAHLRFGVVLSPQGGALARMLPAFRFGLGGRLGSGKQWMSWASLRDVVRVMFFLMDRDDLSGAFNVTAPQPVTNLGFTQALAAAVHRPALFPVPPIALRLAFGEMADGALLASQNAIPAKLERAGFTFQDREIRTALQALLR